MVSIANTVVYTKSLSLKIHWQAMQKLTYHALDLAVKIIALLKDQVQRRKQYVQRANLNFVACAKTNITTIWHVLS